MDILEGVVRDIVFQNEENGYTVARFENDDFEEVIVGCMPTLTQGEHVSISGNFKEHVKFGRQFVVENYNSIMPSTESGILIFLSSGIINGVGEKMAERIVKKFGINSLDIIQKDPNKLLEVEGIGKKKLDGIIKSYSENLGMKRVIMELTPYNISTKHCLKIYKKYGDNAVEIIKENPYEIVNAIPGIGFKTIDKIAMNLGIEKDSEERINQGVLHILKNSINNGHTFLPEQKVINDSSELLDVNVEFIHMALKNLAMVGEVVYEKIGDLLIVYLTRYYEAECSVCNKLIKFSQSTFDNFKYDLDEEIEIFEQKDNIRLAPAQKMAVKAAFENGVMVLTGGPGTGKTTVINTIIKIFKKNDFKVKLAAPTGRAAKRMIETTNHYASTIHRLLEMAFDVEDRFVFSKDEEEPIDCDVVIIDEASMIDIFLMDNLLKAIKTGTRLIFVGDKDQLPSVGAGNVLRDIISSETIMTIKLTEIFRQAKQSMIVVNAHRINNGENILPNEKDKDFFFIEKTDENDMLNEITGLVQKRLPEYYKVDKLKEIQLLSPMRKGKVGVNNLNQYLQNYLNPKAALKEEIQLQKRIFRVGDKVMQIKNNYSKNWENEQGNDTGEGIYNGDIGYIIHIDKHQKLVYVEFDEEKIFKYSYDELDELEHCFCTTVHKSQGSEFPVVIIPISWGPPMLLSRNLLYTAITRAKKLVILVGQKKYLQMMINNDINNDRYSNLGHKLSKFKRIFDEDNL